MRREAERASRRTGLLLEVVEISGDPALERRYGTEVPVLVMPGGETFRGRTVAGEIERAFARASGDRAPRSPQSVAPGQATHRRGGILDDLRSILAWRRRPQA